MAIIIGNEVFHELVINHVLTIPSVKPSMEQLLDYKIEYDIFKAVVFETRLVTNDNPPKPIRKILVGGTAKIVVKYVANVPNQQVHGAHFEEPFSALIEWPGGPSAGTPLCVEVVEEFAQFCMKNEREISKVIVIQLDITIDSESKSERGCD